MTPAQQLSLIAGKLCAAVQAYVLGTIDRDELARLADAEMLANLSGRFEGREWATVRCLIDVMKVTSSSSVSHDKWVLAMIGVAQAVQEQMKPEPGRGPEYHATSLVDDCQLPAGMCR